MIVVLSTLCFDWLWVVSTSVVTSSLCLYYTMHGIQENTKQHIVIIIIHEPREILGIKRVGEMKYLAHTVTHMTYIFTSAEKGTMSYPFTSRTTAPAFVQHAIQLDNDSMKLCLVLSTGQGKDLCLTSW